MDLLHHTALNGTFTDLIGDTLVAVLVWVIYRTLFKIYEKRKITELSAHSLFRNLIAGIFIGTLIQSLVIYVMYVKNDFYVISVNRFMDVLPHMVSIFMNAVTVEILLVGIIFRIMEENLGSYLSLILLALIFGVIHSTIPQGSVVSAVGIALHGGILIGAAYMYSRNLWFPIALHFAWDFTQAGIFGAAISGYTLKHTVLTTRITGSPYITGGYFGPQGSVQSALFCLITAIILLGLCHRRHQIRKPFWHLSRSGQVNSGAANHLG